jgi:hypothetical protein
LFKVPKVLRYGDQRSSHDRDFDVGKKEAEAQAAEFQLSGHFSVKSVKAITLL